MKSEATEDILIKMVGTEGKADLEALCRLLPKDHGFANPFSLAIHFIEIGIENSKDSFQKQIGITSSTTKGE